MLFIIILVLIACFPLNYVIEDFVAFVPVRVIFFFNNQGRKFFAGQCGSNLVGQVNE